jgi:hypothetical protein
MDYVRAAHARIAPHDSVERFSGFGVDVHLASSPMHVYPTLAEANRAVGDGYLSGRLRPGMRAILTQAFTWLRR